MRTSTPAHVPNRFQALRPRVHGAAFLRLGGAGLVCLVMVVALLSVRTVIPGDLPADHRALHGTVQLLMRQMLLLLAFSALVCSARATSPRWRNTTVIAVLVLLCGAAVDLAGVVVSTRWLGEPGAGLASLDDVDRRLLRLSLMAAYAIPLVAILARCENALAPGRVHGPGTGIAGWLVRMEPLLFAIGAATLAPLLAGAALVHRELLWSLPLGADTALAGCAAAAIRARWRADGVALAGWVLICLSMATGLLMGSYAFGAPLPAPSFIGEYDAVPRTLLRAGHVISLTLGIVLVTAALRRKTRGAVS